MINSFFIYIKSTYNMYNNIKKTLETKKITNNKNHQQQQNIQDQSVNEYMRQELKSSSASVVTFAYHPVLRLCCEVSWYVCLHCLNIN